MKKVIYLLAGIIFSVLTVLLLNQMVRNRLFLNRIPGSCTIFSVSTGEKVYYGNNEDYNNPNSYYWTEPATDGNYGCVFLGFEENSLQGGINEKGLCFDANSLPKSNLNPHPELPVPPFEKPPNEKYSVWTPVLMLKKAATVEEAIEIAVHYQRRNWDNKTSFLRYQVNIADAKGDAVIISAGKDGELAFTRKKHGENYLVSTNFNRANPENAWTNPCWRYDKAVKMLKEIKTENDLTVDYIKSILDSVHVEGANNNTLYSNIFDLSNGTIYLYYWHQYHEVVELSVAKELAKGKILISLKDIFSEATVKKASVEHQAYKNKKK